MRRRVVLSATSFLALALASNLILKLSTVEWKALWIVLCFLGLFIAHRMKPMQSFDELGLRSDVVKGGLFGLLASLPMFAVLAIASRLAVHTSLRIVLASVLFGPFAEEILFRGYFFLQLYRRAGWSLPSAVALSSLVFGLIHLRNMRGDRDLGRLLAEVIITGVGGAFFAWLLVRWNNNLWIPIGMHTFMNLWWEVFSIDRTAIGNWIANVARILAVASAIAISLRKSHVSRRTPA